MTEEKYLKTLQKIERLLEKENLPGYLFVLGIRNESNIMIFHHIFKEMNNPDIIKILEETKTKINAEFAPTIPVAITQTKAKA